MDCSLPVSYVHGFLLARILEWVAIPSSRGIFPTQGSGVDSGSPTLQVDSLASEPPGKPLVFNRGLIIAPSMILRFFFPP